MYRAQKMYKFSYEINSEEVNEKIVSVTLEIPDFKKKINEAKTNLFARTTKADYSADTDESLKFELSVRRSFATDKSVIEIYYKPPKDAFLKLSLHALNSYYNREDQELLSTMEYCGVSANMWKLMKVIPTEKLPTYCNSLKLIVKFVMRHDVLLKQDSPERCLKNDLKNLLDNSTLFDITLESVDGVQLPAHKNILAARSEVFKAHFEHGTTESLTNTIKTKFESEILQEVLHYIYTDCAPKLGNIAAGVLVAADYYQLTGLKSLCVTELYNKLTTENAIETLVLADLHSVSSLKDDIVKFVNDENNQAVYESSGWKTLEDAKLLKLIHENIVKKLSTS